MNNEDKYIIQYKYDMGVYSLAEMCKLTEKGAITAKDFHFITGYDFWSIKKEGLH